MQFFEEDITTLQPLFAKISQVNANLKCNKIVPGFCLKKCLMKITALIIAIIMALQDSMQFKILFNRDKIPEIKLRH